MRIKVFLMTIVLLCGNVVMLTAERGTPTSWQRRSVSSEWSVMKLGTREKYDMPIGCKSEMSWWTGLQMSSKTESKTPYTADCRSQRSDEKTTKVHLLKNDITLYNNEWQANVKMAGNENWAMKNYAYAGEANPGNAVTDIVEEIALDFGLFSNSYEWDEEIEFGNEDVQLIKKRSASADPVIPLECDVVILSLMAIVLVIIKLMAGHI